MSRADEEVEPVCPICGSILVEKEGALYCHVCDLLYEADDHHQDQS